MPWSGVGAALAAGGMDLISSGINAYANHREAALNRDFQERMFKNRYQYTVDDLKKAGLNPALAYGNLSASVPAGSQAAGNPVDMSNTGKALARMQENAIKKQSEIADSQIAVNTATANEVNAKADKIRKETSQIPTLTQSEVDNIAKGQNSTYVSQAVRDVYGWMLGAGSNLSASPEQVAERRLNDELNAKAFNGGQMPTVEERKEMARKIAEKVRAEREKTKQKVLKNDGPPVGNNRSVY